jgi:hypothetical protein
MTVHFHLVPRLDLTMLGAIIQLPTVFMVQCLIKHGNKVTFASLYLVFKGLAFRFALF